MKIQVEFIEPKSYSPSYPFIFTLLAIAFCIVFMLMYGVARAETINLSASWYSIASLHRDGQWKITKGVCADGSNFNDNSLTCATRLYPLGTRLLVSNISNGNNCIVTVTDRIGKRFATKRIDLSKGAFRKIALLKQGVISCSVERLK